MRLRFPLLIVCALVALAFFAGCGGGGGGGTGRITGIVYGTSSQTFSTSPTDNTPVGGVLVRVQGTNVQTTTDANGLFTLNNVPDGVQTLIASKTEYKSGALAVTVVSGQTADANASAFTTLTYKWTVLVYLNADNNLEQYGILNFNQMEAVPDSDQVATIVQFDRSPQYDTSNGNWVGCKRMKVKHDSDSNAIHSTVLEDMGNVDMGSWQTLHDFVEWGQDMYPAEHYLVVLWDHGSGALPFQKTSPPVRGISQDYSSNNNIITTVQLDDALSVSPKIDILSYDACLMQMAEVAYQTRNVCDYSVASEENVPGEGYNYTLWLQQLVANPNMAPLDMAKAMSKSMTDYYNGSQQVTESVVDSSKMDQLATAMTTFASALSGVASTYPTQLATARDTCIQFATPDYKDLYDYALKVKTGVNDQNVINAAQGVMNAVQTAVVAKNNTSNYAGTGGIAVYMPTKLTYIGNVSAYQAQAFAQTTGWGNWLSAQQQ
ncbi:MAG: clostripain-related cysteine peptidase [Armatimonadota bacterium]